MSNKKLFADITGTNSPLTVNLNISHNANCAMATFTCINTSLDIGDSIEVDLGYEDNHALLFKGYVKEKTKKVPENIYDITALDEMSRAVDYFIVSSDPDAPFSRSNIEVAHLVRDIMELAGIPNSHFHFHNTSFIIGTNMPVEVNLVSAYDYSKFLGDIVTWHLWAGTNGHIYFYNRKPWVMNDKQGIHTQPGYNPDLDIEAVNYGSPLNDSTILDFTYKRVEKDLRNRVVVYGTEGIHAEASRATSYDPISETYIQVLPTTPDQFYKSAVVATQVVDDTGVAHSAAQYNLRLYNRLKAQVSCTVEGDPLYVARNTILIDESITGLSGLWYMFSTEHSWSRSGYTVSMELNK